MYCVHEHVSTEIKVVLGEKDVEIVKENLLDIRISRSFSVALPMLNIIKILFFNDMANVQARFQKGRGTRDQIANICWIMEKAREFQKNI